MGNNATDKTHSKKARGFIPSTLALVGHLIVVIILAWLCLLVFLAIFRFSEGEMASNMRIHSTLKVNETFLVTMHANNTWEDAEKHLLVWGINRVPITKIMTFIEAQKHQMKKNLPQFNTWGNPFSKLGHALTGFFTQAIPIVMGTTLIILMRVCIAIASIPLFLISIGLGMVDGLVQRDIRKFQGARESTFLFHRVKQSMLFFLLVPLFAYLAFPCPLSPLWFLLPTAVLMGVLTQVSMKTFKKYL